MILAFSHFFFLSAAFSSKPSSVSSSSKRFFFLPAISIICQNRVIKRLFLKIREKEFDQISDHPHLLFCI